MRVTEKRKKEMGDKGLKRERNKSNGFLVYLYTGRCVRRQRKGGRKAKATRCCSKVPLLIEREARRRRRDNGEKRKMKTRSNEMVQKDIIPEREREREQEKNEE